MKYLIIPTLFVAVLSACTSSVKPAETDSTAVSAVTDTTARTSDLALGTYKGDFSGSPIYITINFHSGKHVAGYDTHKGLRRNLSGSLEQEGDNWVMTLNEPGDNPFDGQFKITFSQRFLDATGVWKPTNNSQLSNKSFSLKQVANQFTPKQQESEDFSYLSGDHVDINFDADGSCTLNYYDKVNDSTFAGQMRTVRGTWERKDSAITVNWQKNENWDKTQSVYNLHYEEADLENKYLSSVTGDGFELTLPY